MTLLISYQKQFTYYRHLGEAAMAQLTFEEISRDDKTASNSIAIIVKHMAGNMRSRWTDFLTTDGEKPWRNRDDEFIDDFTDRDSLEASWEQGWSVLESALQQLTADQLEQAIYIRGEAHTVYKAINRQLAHYAYHVGQIVLLAKQVCGEEWQPLSIPRGKSDDFNDRKFQARRGA